MYSLFLKFPIVDFHVTYFPKISIIEPHNGCSVNQISTDIFHRKGGWRNIFLFINFQFTFLSLSQLIIRRQKFKLLTSFLLLILSLWKLMEDEYKYFTISFYKVKILSLLQLYKFQSNQSIQKDFSFFHLLNNNFQLSFTMFVRRAIM